MCYRKKEVCTATSCPAIFVARAFKKVFCPRRE
jgi:hypothetical protein